MNVPHAAGWKETQEANRLAAIAARIYSDDLEPKCDRSSLRAAWATAVKRLGDRWCYAKVVKLERRAA